MTQHDVLTRLVRDGLAALPHDGKPRTQAWLAARLGMTESVLSKTLSGARVAHDSEVAHMADLIGLPLERALLAASILRCGARAEAEQEKWDASNDEVHRHAVLRWRQSLATYSRLLEETDHTTDVEQAPTVAPRRAYVSLENFPNIGDGTWTVVVGDRRETKPKGLGDLVALSASSADFMFLPSLRLPEDTVVLSDKIIRVASGPNLLSLLGKSNVLLLGSPVVNLVTRMMMSEVGATFVFNIGNNWYDRERSLYARLGEQERTDEDALADFLRDPFNDKETNLILPNYMKSGFVDPIDYAGIRGVARPRTRDYGMIALSPSPWSESHWVCACAGVGGGGTAGGLEMLGRPRDFSERPWGGVFKVNLPDQVAWEMRFQFLRPKWDTKGYTPQRYIDETEALARRVSTRAGASEGEVDESIKDINISHQMLLNMTTIGRRLAGAESPANDQ